MFCHISKALCFLLVREKPRKLNSIDQEMADGLRVFGIRVGLFSHIWSKRFS